jgi:hypothetical protein
MPLLLMIPSAAVPAVTIAVVAAAAPAAAAAGVAIDDDDSAVPAATIAVVAAAAPTAAADDDAIDTKDGTAAPVIVALLLLLLLQFLSMEETLVSGHRHVGTCLRTKTQCMPYALTLLTTGYVEIFLLLQPFALIRSNVPSEMDKHVLLNGLQPLAGLLIYFFCAVLLLGVDEVANQLEDPFGQMAMGDMVGATQKEIGR